MQQPEQPSSEERREVLLSRLEAVGCKVPIIVPEYLEQAERTSFRTAADAAGRCLVLDLAADAAKIPIFRWLGKLHLRKMPLKPYFSPRELSYFTALRPAHALRIDMSWGVEAAWALAWALGVVEHDDAALFTPEATHARYEPVTQWIEGLGSRQSEMVATFPKASLRPYWQLYDEACFNELQTGAFRDALVLGRPELRPTSTPDVVHRRHHAFNWLRCWGDGSEWDDVDTST